MNITKGRGNHHNGRKQYGKFVPQPTISEEDEIVELEQRIAAESPEHGTQGSRYEYYCLAISIF